MNRVAWSTAARNHSGIQTNALRSQCRCVRPQLLFGLQKIILRTKKMWQPELGTLALWVSTQNMSAACVKMRQWSRKMHRPEVCRALACLWAVAVWQLAGLSTTHAWKANMLEKGEMKEMELVWLPGTADWLVWEWEAGVGPERAWQCALGQCAEKLWCVDTESDGGTLYMHNISK